MTAKKKTAAKKKAHPDRANRGGPARDRAAERAAFVSAVAAFIDDNNRRPNAAERRELSEAARS